MSFVHIVAAAGGDGVCVCVSIDSLIYPRLASNSQTQYVANNGTELLLFLPPPAEC